METGVPRLLLNGRSLLLVIGGELHSLDDSKVACPIKYGVDESVQGNGPIMLTHAAWSLRSGLSAWTGDSRSRLWFHSSSHSGFIDLSGVINQIAVNRYGIFLEITDEDLTSEQLVFVLPEQRSAPVEIASSHPLPWDISNLDSHIVVMDAIYRKAWRISSRSLISISIPAETALLRPWNESSVICACQGGHILITSDHDEILGSAFSASDIVDIGNHNDKLILIERTGRALFLDVSWR